jgi:hypothetical protein
MANGCDVYPARVRLSSRGSYPDRNMQKLGSLSPNRLAGSLH